MWNESTVRTQTRDDRENVREAARNLTTPSPAKEPTKPLDAALAMLAFGAMIAMIVLSVAALVWVVSG